MYVIVFFFLHKMLASHRQPTFRDRYHEWWYATSYLSITSWDVSGVFFLRLWTCCCLNNNVKRSSWAFSKVVLTEAPMPIRKLLEKLNDEWILSIAILFLDCHTVYFCFIYFFEVFQNFARAQSGLSTRPMSWAFSISLMAWVPTEPVSPPATWPGWDWCFVKIQPLENRRIFMKKCYENPWKIGSPSRNRMFFMEKRYRMLVYWSVYGIYHGLIIWFVLNVMMKCSGHTSNKGGFHTHFCTTIRARCSEGTHFEGFFGAGKSSPQEVCWGYRLHGAFFTLQYPWFLWPDSPVIFVPNIFFFISEDWRMGLSLPVWQWLQWLASFADGKKRGVVSRSCILESTRRCSVGLELPIFLTWPFKKYKISILDWFGRKLSYIFCGCTFSFTKICVPPLCFFWVKCRYPFFRGVWTPRSSTCSGRTRQVSEPWMESCENSCFFWEVLGSAGKHFPKYGNEMFVEQ